VRLQTADGQHDGRNESGLHRCVIAASHVYNLRTGVNRISTTASLG
jgi:hypothetical protein